MKLSDGTEFTPRDAGPTQRNAQDVANAEAYIDEHYRQQAEKLGKPVTPRFVDENGQMQQSPKIYSATRSYPNNFFGHGMASADHAGGGVVSGGVGNWANRNIADPLNATPVVGAAGPMVLRGAANLASTPTDIASTVYNTTKHYMVPKEGTSGDMPYMAPAVERATGTPQMDPNAGFVQRATEAAIPALMTGNPTSLMGVAKPVAQGVLSTAGSDIGGAVGGEAGSVVGSALGALHEPLIKAALPAAKSPTWMTSSGQPAATPPSPPSPGFFSSLPNLATLGSGGAAALATYMKTGSVPATLAMAAAPAGLRTGWAYGKNLGPALAQAGPGPLLTFGASSEDPRAQFWRQDNPATPFNPAPGAGLGY